MRHSGELKEWVAIVGVAEMTGSMERSGLVRGVGAGEVV